MKKMTLQEFVDKINEQLQMKNIPFKIVAEPFEDDDGVIKPQWDVEFMGVRLLLPVETSDYGEEYKELEDLQSMAAELLADISRINPRVYEKAEKYMQEIFDELTPEPEVVVEMDGGYRFSYLVMKDSTHVSIANIEEITSWMEYIAKFEIGESFLEEKINQLMRKTGKEYKPQIEEIVGKHGYDIVKLDYGGRLHIWMDLWLVKPETRAEHQDESDFLTRVDGSFKYSYPVVKVPFLSPWIEHKGIPDELATELLDIAHEIRKVVEKEVHQVRIKMLELGIEPFVMVHYHKGPPVGPALY